MSREGFICWLKAGVKFQGSCSYLAPSVFEDRPLSMNRIKKIFNYRQHRYFHHRKGVNPEILVTDQSEVDHSPAPTTVEPKAASNDSVARTPDMFVALERQQSHSVPAGQPLAENEITIK